MIGDEYRGFFCIHIDPSKTYVYLSEARAVYFGYPMWRNSRLSLAEYQKLCRENKDKIGAHYHTISGIRSDYTGEDMVHTPPEFNGEILVGCTIPPCWRVRVKPETTNSGASLGLCMETLRIMPRREIFWDD